MAKGIPEEFLKPMLATLVDEPFDDPKWVFEVKWDGYRLMVKIASGKAALISRNGLDVSKKYPAICKAFAKVKKDAVIDGELVALDEKGKPRFQLMQHAAERNPTLVFYAFDLPYFDGDDLRDLPLLERKRLLKKILPKNDAVRLSEHAEAHGKKFFAAAQKQGLEGVVGKRADSRYLSGKRSEDWLKIKTSKRQEAVVVGFTKPRNSRKY
ncbi:MAG: DNA ligase, partial [Candidatus Kaiserbacteria bacterium]|nr:DNA ligase [Candidatus Kaiserbacteria bacterium]